MSQSNVNSATKSKPTQKPQENRLPNVRKFSTGDEMMDEDTFKNRTLRFTNNNFVGNIATSKHRDTSGSKVEGWENQDPKVVALATGGF
jgi:hypothetical protein